jgi:adenosylcobinamide-GDP ribazoletransferase
MIKLFSRFARHFLLSVQFFTRIPVTGRLADWVGFSPAMLRASAAHFPGVGWLVGGLVAAFTTGLLAWLPPSVFTPLVVSVWGTAFGVLLTGAFHEDGLADVFDGLGGSPERDRALVIMKDSRVGAFGAIALMLVLLGKVSLLALIGSVSPAQLCGVLFLAHVVSRTWPLLLIRFMPHVGDVAGSKSKPLADQISRGSLGVAFIWVCLAFSLVGWAQITLNLMVSNDETGALFQALVNALGASGLTLLLLWSWFWRRLQGFTGDCLGATQQLCELAFYLGFALSL